VKDGALDSNEMNYFNEHSYTREQFREHHCYKQQKMIEDKFNEQEIFSKIKMLLLQNCKTIVGKGALKPAKEFECQNTKCKNGWFNQSPPAEIMSGPF
jgi:hypothetical protein